MNTHDENGAIRERLAHAHERQTSGLRRLLKYLAAIAILATMAAGAWYGYGHLEELLRRPHIAPEASRTAAPPPEALQPEAQPAETVATTAPDSAEHDRHDAAQEQEAAREQEDRYRQALQQFDSVLAPAPPGSPGMPGSEAIRERIAPYLEKARAARDGGDLHSALRLLSEAEREASAMAGEAEGRYRLAFQAAKDAYAAGDAPGARTYIEQALAQWPGAPEAQAWQARITKLPEILAEYRKADAARAVGDLRGEGAALKRIVALDPDDAGARQRALAVEEEGRERAFAAAIGQGRQALDEKNLAAAKQAAAAAARQRPRHEDTLRLQAGVAALERAGERDRHLADAEQAAVRDDWKGALQAFEQAAALDPDDGSAVQGKDIAGRIVAAQRAVDDFLAHPDRLSDPAIAATARRTLAETVVLAALSPRLEASGRELDRAIDAMQAPVQVLIVSDNNTEIGIRGVGTIGRVEQRTIELLPGTYVFEGKRKGYRSKLVKVTVAGDGISPAEVTIVCDERV